MMARQGGKWVPLRLHVSQTEWPARADLPNPIVRYPARGRDGFYDDRVAGRLIMEPLRAAIAFMESPANDLRLDRDAVPTLLSVGTGLDQVLELTDRADITLT